MLSPSARKAAALVLLVSALLVLVLVMVGDSVTTRNYRRLYAPAKLAPSNVGDENNGPIGDITLNTISGDGASCSPRNSIFFLKTHKCASSTIQNILMRYGERRSLNFVLGERGNYVGSPAPFNRRFIGESLWPRSGRFDIFTHHTRLHVQQTREVMQPGAAFVTILRDPITQFESMYDYAAFSAPSAWNMTLQEFISLPLEQKVSLRRLSNGVMGGNQMSFDLGYDPAIVSQPKLVNNMLEELDSAFDLVMIAEMMDESLVLLRQLMCWSTDDIVYLTKNARFNSRRKQLSAGERQLLEEFLALDMIVYRHFAQRLAQQIAAVPLPTFLAQSEKLVARRLYFKQRCVTAEVNGGKLAGQQHEISTKIKGYQLSDSTDWMCSRLAMAELGYTDLIREQQRQRLAIWRRVYDILGLEQLDENSPDEG